MMEYLNNISVFAWVATALFALAGMFIWWTKANEAAWFDFLYCFPVSVFGKESHIGRLKTLKANTEQVASKQSWEHGMPKPESVLCTDYKTKMGTANSASEFKSAKEYLRLSYQSDVGPMSFWAYAILIGLTIAETLGTGFLLAPFISDGMSSSQIGYGAWFAAVALAGMLLLATHFAGESAKLKMSIQNILGTLDQNAVPEGVGKDNSKITYNADQSQDEGKSAEARFYRRAVKLKERGSWAKSIFLGVLLVFVVAGVFGLRWYGIKKQNTVEVVQLTKNGVGEVNSDGGNPFAAAGVTTALPPDVTQSVQQSREKVAKEIGDADLMQGFGAAFLLALIYVFTQAAGFIFAYKHAFISEGKKAYLLTRGEASYQSYHTKYVLPFEGRAESRLADLRSHFGSVIPEYARSPATKMFKQFVKEQQVGDDDCQSAGQSGHIAHVTQDVVLGVVSLAYDANAEPIANLPKDKQAEAIESWLSENGRKHKTEFIAAVDRFNARKAAPQGGGDTAMYDTAVKTIMGLPDAEREPAMVTWLADNGTKHEDGIMEAIARFVEKQTAAPKLNSRLSSMLKGNNA